MHIYSKHKNCSLLLSMIVSCQWFVRKINLHRSCYKSFQPPTWQSRTSAKRAVKKGNKKESFWWKLDRRFVFPKKEQRQKRETFEKTTLPNPQKNKWTAAEWASYLISEMGNNRAMRKSLWTSHVIKLIGMLIVKIVLTETNVVLKGFYDWINIWEGHPITWRLVILLRTIWGSQSHQMMQFWISTTMNLSLLAIQKKKCWTKVVWS